MARRLEGRVAIVTGASSGMGKVTAFQLAREGASVVLAARRDEEGEAAAQEIRDLGGIAKFVRTDVSKWDDVSAMVEFAVTEFGGLHCAFNNAGLSARGTDSWLDVSEETWDQMIDINLKGVWMCTRHEVTAMIETGGGSIVNNSSLFGMRGGGSAPYTASKHGVIGLSKSAAVSFARQSIRVNSIAPGIIMTPIMEARLADNPEMADQAGAFIPEGTIGSSEAIAETVTWLLSDESAYITGECISVDGGVMAQLFPPRS